MVRPGVGGAVGCLVFGLGVGEVAAGGGLGGTGGGTLRRGPDEPSGTGGSTDGRAGLGAAAGGWYGGVDETGGGTGSVPRSSASCDGPAW
jgi:hypothetical protein